MKDQRLEDFDWSKLDKKREVYSDSEREEMERMYDETLDIYHRAHCDRWYMLWL